MADKKTIALFGAGSGLGASLASLFGREGYNVALVARRAGPLDERVAELAQAGIEAAAFPADLTDIAGIPALVRSIEDRFGSIEVAVYAPVPADSALIPAADVDASKLQAAASVFTFAPVEVSHAVLPGMLARGDGAIVVVAGLSAVIPIPGFGSIGPLMAAARHYIFTLNAEMAGKGVYVGTVNVGAMIDRSAGLRAAKASGSPLASGMPVIDPDVIASEIWTRITKRDQVEAIVPPLPEK